MNDEWHAFADKAPPEKVILLVNGPLGIDLAVKLEDNLYFKKGDDWSPGNLELWRHALPRQWAALTPPDGESGFDKITSIYADEPLRANEDIVPLIMFRADSTMPMSDI